MGDRLSADTELPPLRKGEKRNHTRNQDIQQVLASSNSRAVIRDRLSLCPLRADAFALFSPQQVKAAETWPGPEFGSPKSGPVRVAEHRGVRACEVTGCVSPKKGPRLSSTVSRAPSSSSLALKTPLLEFYSKTKPLVCDSWLRSSPSCEILQPFALSQSTRCQHDDEPIDPPHPSRARTPTSDLQQCSLSPPRDHDFVRAEIAQTKAATFLCSK